MKTLRCLSLLVAAVLAACGQSGDPGVEARAAGGNDAVAPAFPVAQAELRGPITSDGIHGHALWDSWFDLDPLGYLDEEYFVSGTAKIQPDGAEAPYVTRILVTRP